MKSLFIIFTFLISSFCLTGCGGKKQTEIETLPHNLVKEDIREYIDDYLRYGGGGLIRITEFEDLHRPDPTPEQVQFTFKAEVQIVPGKEEAVEGAVRYDKIGTPTVYVFGWH